MKIMEDLLRRLYSTMAREVVVEAASWEIGNPPAAAQTRYQNRLYGLGYQLPGSLGDVLDATNDPATSSKSLLSKLNIS